MIRGCFLYLGTVYIGWKTIEIFKTINVMKIVLASFLFIFSYWCVGRLWFFYWRNDWNQEYLSNTLNIFVKCAENFSEAFQNNKQVSAETEKPCQNVLTPFLMAFLPEHVQGICKIHLMQFLALVKQSGLNDMPIKFYVKKSENNWDYEKMPLKMG